MTDILNLATEIADALDGWQVSDSQPTSLDGPAGAGLYLRAPYWEKDRIVVGACWPAADVNGQHETFQPYFSSYGSNPTKAPRITCAIARGAEAIAKDIVRRFLPQYLPLYEQQVERMAATLEGAAYRRDILDRLNATGLMQGTIHLTVSPPEITFDKGYLKNGQNSSYFKWTINFKKWISHINSKKSIS